MILEDDQNIEYFDFILMFVWLLDFTTIYPPFNKHVIFIFTFIFPHLSLNCNVLNTCFLRRNCYCDWAKMAKFNITGIPYTIVNVVYGTKSLRNLVEKITHYLSQEFIGFHK